MNPCERKIATMVGAVFRCWRRRQVQCHAAALAAGLLAWLLAMIVLDNLLMLSAGQLVAGWFLMGVAGAATAGVLLYRLTVARPAADRLALLYEAHVPGQHNRLINAVQFVANRRLRAEPLVQAVIAQNAAALELAEAPRAIDPRPLRRLLVAAVAGFSICALYVALRPAWGSNALARLLRPLNPPPHLRATEPTVRPGDVEVVEGAVLIIEADVPAPLRGVRPARVLLEYRVGTPEWIQTAMSAAPASRCDGGNRSANTFTHTFPAVWRPVDYRVRAGRSLSPIFHVGVQARPRIQSLQVCVTRPAYAGGQCVGLGPNVGDVVALAGSTVDVALTASVPLRAGRLELSDGTAVPLRIEDRDDTLGGRAAFRLERSGSYAIWLIDGRGLSNVNPPRYTLTAEPDQAPQVIIARPGRDLVLPADALLDLHIEAEDDLGLARVIVQTRHGEADWADTLRFESPPPGLRHRAIDASLALRDFGLLAGDVLLYRAVAYDGCQPQANAGIGRTWSVAIGAAETDADLLAANVRRLLDALQQLLAWQRENRAAFDLDRAAEPIRRRQRDIRDLTTRTVERERKGPRPDESALAELVALADGPMLQTIRSLDSFGGGYAERQAQKPPILKVMDEIIARLEALVGQVAAALARAEQAQQALARLPEREHDQALAAIRDLLEKFHGFLPEQDEVIAQTEELVRRAEDLTDADRQKIERLKGTEDKWAEVFADSVKDIDQLTEQGFADRSIANDYKEMVEQIEAASLNLTPELVQLAVPREQSGRELAESLVEEMEMWLPNSPDYIRWIMEEPLDFPEIPLVDLPDQLWDYIGELIEEQDALNDAAEDVTSAWADSLAEGAGWDVTGGPISNFSAVGKTGNQLPDNNEASGRSGEGRSGRSQGQLVEDVAKGLAGRANPTRATNDAYEQGVVRELQQMATGGATGGGKARGAGQEGLQGTTPPPLHRDLQRMQDWQARIRQQAERVVGQLQVVRVELPSLEEAVRLMRAAELATEEGRYADMFRTQHMVLQNLRRAGDLATREMALNVQRARHLPPEHRRQILDAMDEPVPEEYEDAVRRYFEQLSETR